MGNKLDVLFWAAIKPIKNGTFEDYMLRLSRACESAGQSIKFVLLAPIDQAVEARFNQAGLDYELLDEQSHASKRKLAGYLRRLKPRVLHLHFYGAGSPLLLGARITSRAKILLHDHNSRPETITSHNGRWAIFGALQYLRRTIYGLFVDQIIAVSDFLAKTIQHEMHLPSKKIRVIYNGVDTDRFLPVKNRKARQQEAQDVFGRNIQNPIVTFVGMLNDDKGVGVFLETIRNLSAEGVKAYYVIVGDGPMRQQVEEAAKELGPENLSYLGLRNDIDRILRASDIFAAPYKWEEAFGLTLIEAAASGLPIIASDVGAIAEVIGENDGGIRITPGDSHSLARAIKYLVSDEGYRHKLGALACKRAKRLYSLDKMVGETLDLYR